MWEIFVPSKKMVGARIYRHIDLPVQEDVIVVNKKISFVVSTSLVGSSSRFMSMGT